jgi:hypothetical protein
MFVAGKSVEEVSVALNRTPASIQVRATILSVSTSSNMQVRNARNRKLLAKKPRLDVP